VNEVAQIPQSRLALQQACAIAQPLATWLLRAGVGHRDFAVALKTVFLQAAQSELERIGGKQTDSALSLLSGLHRKDVRALLPGILIPAFGSDPQGTGRPTPGQQVVTRWLTEHDGQPLPFGGPAPSFEALAVAVSQDIRPRSLLLELVRLGVAEDGGAEVRLVRQAFIPDSTHGDAARMVAGSTADHLAAAIQNLTGTDGKTHLEQSVFADGLSPESVRELEQLANQLWRHVLRSSVKLAQPLSDADEAKGGGNMRFRLGMYSYSAPVAPETPLGGPSESSESSES